jgi:pimeloyl-ACP methyl ester carboxylesterase
VKGDHDELISGPGRPRVGLRAPNLPAGFTGPFTSRYIDAGEMRLPAVTGEAGPPLLLMHGWPQTWYAWRIVTPALVRDFSVVGSTSAVSGSSRKVESYVQRN